MHLQSITLTGYRSARHGSPVTLEQLGRFNILIGPNNSGKSTVLRFLQVLASHVLVNTEVPIKLPWADADRSWWWKGAIDHPINATLCFAGPAPAHALDDEVPGKFEQDGTWRISVDVRATLPANPEFCCIVACADVYLEDGWRAVVRPSEADGTRYEYLNKQGQYVFSSGTDTCPYRAAGVEMVRAWARTARFFDPVRAIDRAGGRRELVDGADLLAKIREQQLDQKQSYAFSQFRRRLIDELNALIVEPGSGGQIKHFEIKGAERLDLYFERDGDGAPIALEYMGTGIAELTVLMADMLQNPGIRQYFMEEPECHLHPRLLRRLLARLRRQPQTQFYITTHANAVLDGLTEEDRVYRFAVEPNRGTVVQRCSDFIEHGRTLDALGVSGGTLLQTNCVLWVEGPSDRIYLAAWLKHRLTSDSSALVEGSDFAFVFYGGKVLSHFAFADRGPDDFVRLIDVCRFSAVVMDLDITPEESTEKVRDTKARIREEAEKDPDHRLAIFTAGREIENDIDATILRTAVARMLKMDSSRLSTLQLSGKKRYFEEIVEHLGLKDEEAKTAKRKLQDKVGLAELVAEEWTAAAEVPPYIDELLELINRSRLS
jgi:energy-coupling factor transporter ATP-binding protein EcfA2